MSANHQGNPNPTNSAVVQALLDVVAAAKETGKDEALAVFQTALSALQHDKRLMYSADAKFNAHRYPERVITYAKLATYEQCPERFTLSHGAQIVYDFFVSIMTQDGLIRVPQTHICNALHIKRTSYRQYIAELCQYHFIAIYDKPPKGSRTPPTYMIDRRISRTGRDPRDQENTEYMQLVDRSTNGRQSLTPPKYQREIITQKCPDGKIVRIGTIVPISGAEAEKKKPASVITTDASSLMPKPRINDTMALNKLSTNIIPPPDIDDIIIPDINNTDGV